MKKHEREMNKIKEQAIRHNKNIILEQEKFEKKEIKLSNSKNDENNNFEIEYKKLENLCSKKSSRGDKEIKDYMDYKKNKNLKYVII